MGERADTVDRQTDSPLAGQQEQTGLRPESLIASQQPGQRHDGRCDAAQAGDPEQTGRPAGHAGYPGMAKDLGDVRRVRGELLLADEKGDVGSGPGDAHLGPAGPKLVSERRDFLDGGGEVFRAAGLLSCGGPGLGGGGARLLRDRGDLCDP